MSVLRMWGGTAGNWARRTLDLDEIEIMIVASKSGRAIGCKRRLAAHLSRAVKPPRYRPTFPPSAPLRPTPTFAHLAGDVARLHGLPTAWRRRAGNWRTLYDLHPDRGLILVASIRRRTSTTY